MIEKRKDVHSGPNLGIHLLHNVGTALATRIVTSLLGVVTFGLMARSLGAAGLGVYRTVLTLLLFSTLAFDLGLSAISLRDLAHPEVDQGGVMGNAVALRFASATLACVLLASGITVFGGAGPLLSGVIIASIGWVLYQVFDVLRVVFQLKLAQKFVAIAETAGVFIALMLVAIFAALHAGPGAMLAATSTGFCVTGLLGWYFATRLLPMRLRFEPQVWRYLILSGLPVAGSVILAGVQVRVDVLLLSAFRTPAEVGIYDPAIKLYELLLVVPVAFGALLLPLFTRDRHARSRNTVDRLKAALQINSVFSMLVCAVLLVHGEAVIQLIAGDRFLESAGPLRIVAVASVLSGTSAILRSAAVSAGRQGQMLRADVIGASAAIVAHLILIPRFGYMGAAIGKLCGDAVTSLAALTVFRRELGNSVLMTVLTAVSAGVGLALALRLADASGIPWLLSSALFGCASIGALLLVPGIRRSLRCLGSPPERSGLTAR